MDDLQALRSSFDISADKKDHFKAINHQTRAGTIKVDHCQSVRNNITKTQQDFTHTIHVKQGITPPRSHSALSSPSQPSAARVAGATVDPDYPSPSRQAKA